MTPDLEEAFRDLAIGLATILATVLRLEKRLAGIESTLILADFLENTKKAT